MSREVILVLTLASILSSALPSMADDNPYEAIAREMKSEIPIAGKNPFIEIEDYFASHSVAVEHATAAARACVDYSSPEYSGRGCDYVQAQAAELVSKRAWETANNVVTIIGFVLAEITPIAVAIILRRSILNALSPRIRRVLLAVSLTWICSALSWGQIFEWAAYFSEARYIALIVLPAITAAVSIVLTAWALAGNNHR